MKVPLLVLASTILTSYAGDFRTWTEAGSKRTIDGTITDKKSDGSAAKIVTKDDKTVWIESAKLLPADQEYIRKWIGADGRLTVRVIGSGKGWKELKVSFQAGASPLDVQAYDKWPHRTRGPSRNLKAGESGEFSYRAHSEYRVIAWSESKEVDRETDKRKTGL